jgi:TM2 domain-containing membrane protein YozV
MNEVKRKTKLAAALWCFFLGVFGAHYFYVGKIGIGILHFLTLGALGLWTLIDFIRILVGNFTDKSGSKITE